MHGADVDAYRKTGKWGRNRVSDDDDNAGRIQRTRANILLERLDEQGLRAEVEELIEASVLVHTAPSVEAVTDALVKFTELGKMVSRLLGRVVRESWPE